MSNKTQLPAAPGLIAAPTSPAYDIALRDAKSALMRLARTDEIRQHGARNDISPIYVALDALERESYRLRDELDKVPDEAGDSRSVNEIIELPGIPFHLRKILQSLLDFYGDSGTQPFGDVINEGAVAIQNSSAALALAHKLVGWCEAELLSSVESFDDFLREKSAELANVDFDALRQTPGVAAENA